MSGDLVLFDPVRSAEPPRVSTITGLTAVRTFSLAERVASVPVDGQVTTWRQATLLGVEAQGRPSNERHRVTVWRLYWLGGPTAHDDVRAKLLQGWQAMRGLPDDGAAIHLVSSLADAAAAEQQLAAFVRENFTMLTRTLAQARESR